MSGQDLELYIKNTLEINEGNEDENGELQEILKICKELGIKKPEHFQEKFCPKAALISAGVRLVSASSLFEAAPQTGNQPTLNTADSALAQAVAALSYKVPWGKIGYQDLLEQNKKLKNSTMTEIRCAVSEDVMVKFNKQNPGKPVWDKIAREMADKYPYHFASLPVDESTEVSCSAWARSLINNWEYVRNLGNGEDDDEEAAPPKFKRVKKSATFGCPNYSPALPDGENVDSMEAERLKLLQIAELPAVERDMTKGLDLLRSTFYLQREIVTNPENRGESPLPELMEKFPLLIDPVALLQHFWQLTGKNSGNLTDVYVLEKMIPTLKFLKNHVNSSGKKAIHIYEGIKQRSPKPFPAHMRYFAFMHLVAFYLCENMAGLIRYHEEPHVDNSVIEQAFQGVATPLIIAVGPDRCRCQDYRVMAEGLVVSRVISFHEALMVAFACYYIFGASYAPSVKRTLQFYQQQVMQMPNEKGQGSKAVKEGGGTAVENLKKIADIVQGVKDFAEKVNECASKF